MSDFRYEDYYYAAKIVREFAAGELTNPNSIVLEPDYFHAIADKLQAAAELNRPCG